MRRREFMPFLMVLPIRNRSRKAQGRLRVVLGAAFWRQLIRPCSATLQSALPRELLGRGWRRLALLDLARVAISIMRWPIG
jgi:hypothetical protein